MSPAAEDLKSKLAALPVEERAELAAFLIHSLDMEQDPNWESAWEAELHRREQEILSGKAVGEPAEQVLAELRKKYS